MNRDDVKYVKNKYRQTLEKSHCHVILLDEPLPGTGFMETNEIREEIIDAENICYRSGI